MAIAATVTGWSRRSVSPSLVKALVTQFDWYSFNLLSQSSKFINARQTEFSHTDVTYHYRKQIAIRPTKQSRAETNRTQHASNRNPSQLERPIAIATTLATQPTVDAAAEHGSSGSPASSNNDRIFQLGSAVEPVTSKSSAEQGLASI